MGRKSIEIPPEPIGFNRNVSSCPAVRSFENRVFDEMANSV
jgi:hypothetical protein